MPDVIVIPVGDGVTLSSIAKGFCELRLCGVTSKILRLIGTQVAGCQPLKTAWEHNKKVHPVHSPTIADGIAVENPINATMALCDVRESTGAFLTVSDETIINAVHILASSGDILAEPARAAAFAGIQEAVASGLIERDQTVVVLVLKTLHHIRSLPSSTAHVVHADIDEMQLSALIRKIR